MALGKSVVREMVAMEMVLRLTITHISENACESKLKFTNISLTIEH